VRRYGDEVGIPREKLFTAEFAEKVRRGRGEELVKKKICSGLPAVIANFTPNERLPLIFRVR
jgi:hypothetical protein